MKKKMALLTMAVLVAAGLSTSAMAEEKDPITIWCWDTSENGLKMNQAFTDATGIEVIWWQWRARI